MRDSDGANTQQLLVREDGLVRVDDDAVAVTVRAEDLAVGTRALDAETSDGRAVIAARIGVGEVMVELQVASAPSRAHLRERTIVGQLIVFQSPLPYVRLTICSCGVTTGGTQPARVATRTNVSPRPSRTL